MIRPRIFGCFVLGLMSALVLNASAGEKSDAKITAKAEASKIGADGKQKVTITIAIQKSWYIYANPVKAEDFEDNATRVTFLKGKDKLKAEVSYPAGKTKESGKFRYNVYEDKVVIDAVVQRAAGDTGPLAVAIEINSCSGGTCLAPATVRLTVP